MRRPRSIPVIVVSLLPIASPLAAQRSLAMQTDPPCSAADANTPENRAAADAWVRDQLKAFLPEPGQSLRMRRLEELAQQAELAKGQIMMTCEQYRNGKIDFETADRALAGFEQMLADFNHELANEGMVLAAGGQVAQIDAIRKNLSTTGAIGRQAALLGLNELADEAWRTMVRTLTNFSTAFLQTCWTQRFADELPLGLNGQHQILGLDIDVMPCANRRFKGESTSYTFESCSFRGVGDWRVRWAPDQGLVAPKGEGSGTIQLPSASGPFKVEWRHRDLRSVTEGTMKMRRTETRDAEGNLLSAKYYLSTDVTVSHSGKNQIKVDSKGLGGLMAQLNAEARGGGSGSPPEMELLVSDLPCRSLDG